MIPKACKRLAEVDFPIAVVSKYAVREKPVVRRHPQSLHQWWARRPLASSRAMLLALLLPDPCDAHCPPAFKTAASEILREVRHAPQSDAELRAALLWFVGAFANWDMAAHSTYLRVGRNLVRAAHGEEVPLVVDPFAGGGSIPLEALRLGCETFASDLNPVACLMLKVALRDIPRQTPVLADELLRFGEEIRMGAQRDLSDLYPSDPDGATPIAYLWARTVRCEAPACGAEIPILRTLWLSKKGASRARYFRESSAGQCKALLVTRNPVGGPIEFRIASGEGSEVAKDGYAELLGTKAKGNTANVICRCCGTLLTGNKKNPRVQTQLLAQNGGADVVFDENGQRVAGATLIAVVTRKPGKSGRHYRLPVKRDYEAVRHAQRRVARIHAAWDREGRRGLCPMPDERLPPIGTLGFRVQRYGMLSWGDLFTARQRLVLATFCKGIAARTQADDVTSQLAAFIVSRISDRLASLVSWDAGGEKLGHVFGRQALPMVWDFAEGQPFAGATGSYSNVAHQIAGAVEAISSVISDTGEVQLADAADHPLPDESAMVWFTDPPYYDAVPYADLSDFFLVWLKRALPGDSLLGDPFDPDNPLAPKIAEVVQDKTKKGHRGQKNRAWFEEAMATAFAEGRRSLRPDGVGTVVFAHKTTEGWEALLSGMVRGGWTITGSWPIATERPGRLRSRDSAALATSVHLVCRPRSEEAAVGDWVRVLHELPIRVGNWMSRLEGEGVRGADLVFACVGPALETFSRYSRVETADGREVSLTEYLGKVWEVVSRAALENILGGAGGMPTQAAVEEDARLTALFLWTLQTTADEEAASGDDEERAAAQEEDEEESAGKAKSYSLVFDVVRRFAQPLGIDLGKWERRTIETKKGVVRLLPVAERAVQLFGRQGSQAVAAWLEQEVEPGTDPLQGVLFPDRQEGAAVAVRERSSRYGDVDSADDRSVASPGTTTLDRVHTGMLLQAGGRTNALRALVQAERERGPDFLRLANALSALYPRGSNEKRLLDAMLLAVPR